MSHEINHLYEFGPFCLDATERLLLREGATVALTPKAFDLLFVLVERRGRLLEKDELLKLVWPDTFVEEANLSYNISLIRKALGDGENGHRFIETVPKRGYRFAAEVREVAAEPAGEMTVTPLDSPATQPDQEPMTADCSVVVSAARRPRHIAFFAFAGLTLLAVIFGIHQWRNRRMSAPKISAPELKITPLTSFTGTEGQPAFSPDGNQIAFVWDGEREDNPDIYIKQIDGGGLLRLTTHPERDDKPTWSPDGRSIAFVRKAADAVGVYLIPAIGGAERKLFEMPAWLSAWKKIEFSPDGKFLVFAQAESETAPHCIYLFSLETGAKRQLTRPLLPMGDVFPTFSPDGQTIAFLRRSENTVYLVPVTGGEPRRLQADLSMVWDLAWSADGREIICADLRENGHKIYRIPIHGGKAEEIPLGERVAQLAVSRQRNRLAFVRNNHDLNIWRLALTESPMPKPTRLITSTHNDHNPEYSADGKRIIFGSSRSGSNQIWISDSDGSNATQLTFLKSDCGSPRLSPDGQQIVFDASIEGQREILTIPAAGGQPRQITTESSEEIVPGWSRDGRWIYFSSNRSGSLQIWKTPATGGPAVQLTRQGGFEALESWDGKFIYYTKERNVPGIWRMPVEGGAEELLLIRHHAGYWRHWTVVKDGIYFVTAEDRFHPLLKFFNFASGQITRIAVLEKPIMTGVRGIEVSPDGKWLLFTQVDNWGSDIMLLDNFH